MKYNISKLLLFGLILMLILVCGYVSYSFNVRPTAPTTTDSLNSVGGDCAADSCLYQRTGEGVEGFTHLVGFYTKDEKVSSEGDKKVTCDAFTVTNNDNPLAKDLIEWVKQHNGINRLDEKNRLVLTVNLQSIPESLRTTITNSLETSPIELAVVAPRKMGRGAPDCFSFVDIINASSATSN